MGTSIADTLNYCRKDALDFKRSNRVALVYPDGSFAEFNLEDALHYENARRLWDKVVGIMVLIQPTPSNPNSVFKPEPVWKPEITAPNLWRCEPNADGYEHPRPDCLQPDVTVAARVLIELRDREIAYHTFLLANPEKHLTWMLRRHDWTYSMSDDPGVYRAGSNQNDHIRALMRKMDKDKAEIVWKKHADPRYSFPAGIWLRW